MREAEAQTLHADLRFVWQGRTDED